MSDHDAIYRSRPKLDLGNDFRVKSEKDFSLSSNSNGDIIQELKLPIPKKLPTKPGSTLSYDLKICTVCCTRESDCVVMPCGHAGVCHICAISIFDKNGTCPICRQVRYVNFRIYSRFFRWKRQVMIVKKVL